MFYLAIGYDCHIIILALVIIIVYQLLSYSSGPGITLGQFLPWHLNSSLDCSSTLNRGAQVDGRTTHPVDEALTFSLTVMILDDIPLGFQDTQSHDLITANEYGTVQAVVDDPRYDRNSINSVESQDDACFSDNSGEECQTLLSTKNIFKSAENNARLNQANLIDRQPTIQL
ncbi:unnamed protein product [Rotaria sp. Silwood1]|nr:unnamed protein product [Rotaria sp. Silwood1]